MGTLSAKVLRPGMSLLLAFAVAAEMTGSAHAARRHKPKVSYPVETSFTEIKGDIPNPERGFHRDVNLMSEQVLSDYRERDGFTLGRAYIRLDKYRTRNLDQKFFQDLQDGFDRVRAAGIKVVLRFSYNFGEAPDAPLAWVLRHITQLGPILKKNADVIAVLQAGFIGQWGEWHHSTNGLDNPSAHRTIVAALVKHVPKNIAIQLRNPDYKPETGITSARIGFHNDCFLASADDYGTFKGEGAEDSFWRKYLAQQTRHAIMGGETCYIRPDNGGRQHCGPAMAEMRKYHFTYLNASFEETFIKTWEREGCYPTIQKNLGYRLVLKKAALTASTLAPGETLKFAISVSNEGYARPNQPRPIIAVLRDSSGAIIAQQKLKTSARALAPGARAIKGEIQVPAGAAPGTYSLALWLPDRAAGLQSDSRYSIRFANEGVWEESTGHNVLTQIEVAGSSVQ